MLKFLLNNSKQISALKGENVDDLLETIMLVAEVTFTFFFMHFMIREDTFYFMFIRLLMKMVHTCSKKSVQTGCGPDAK